MGHGGRREGAGRKKKISLLDAYNDKPSANDDKPEPQSVNQKVESDKPEPPKRVAAEARRPLFSDEAAYEMVAAMMQKSQGRRRDPSWNPYLIRPELFGAVAAHVEKHAKGKTMAMDDNLMSANQTAVQAWMAGGALSNIASEGLLFLGYPYLSELMQRPEYRLFGEIPAEEMTRKWIRVRGTDDESEKDSKKPNKKNDDDQASAKEKQANDEAPRTDDRNKEIEQKIKELNDFLDHLNVRQVFKDAAMQDAFFGISHVLLDLRLKREGESQSDEDLRNDPELGKSVGNGRDSFTEAKFRGEKDFFRGMRTIEPLWCYPTVYNAANPMIKTWYDPQEWYVMGTQIHKTRLLSFIGRPVPDILKPAYAFGGLAMTQMAQPYVTNWLRTRTSVGEIIHAFSVMVLSTNLSTQTMPGVGGGAGWSSDLLQRLALFVWGRDNQGVFAIDKTTEDFKNISAPLGGLDELQAQTQEHMSSVSRIPLVKLTGIQPKGLNATSDGELRAFEETIAGAQENLFRQHLRTVIDLAQYSLWGDRDKDITFEFVPLREMTPKENAEIRKMEAETDTTYVNGAILSPEEVRTRLVNDPESGYDNLDPDDVPDLLEEEEEGLEPQGGRPQPQAEQGEKAQGLKVVKGGKDGGFQNDDDDPDEEEEERIEAGGGIRTADGRPFGIDEFNPAQHPRGQPGNAGQFGPGGGGGAKNKTKAEKGESKSAGSSTPLKPADLTKIAPAKGSNPGGVYKDKSGKEFYIKKLKSPDHVKSELTAAALYKLAGVPTLQYHSVEGEPEGIATSWEKLDKTNASELSPEEKKLAQRNFFAHAWLANWDAIGTGGDNIGVKGGKVIPLDFGGALAYRAQGEPKGALFGNYVDELESMRDKDVNPDAAKIFGTLSLNSPEAVKSAMDVLRITDDQIHEAVEASGGTPELAEKLIARKENIAYEMGIDIKDPDFEAKHGRGPGGKFAKKEDGEEPKASGFKSKKELIGHLLKMGTTTKEVLKETGWPSVSMPQQAAALGMKLTKEKQGGEWVYVGTPMTDEEKSELVSAAKQVKAQKVEPPPQAPEKPKEAPKPEPAPTPKPEPAKHPPPTESELAKAKKSVPLKVQYVPGAPEGDPEAQKLVDAFNDKYAGKELSGEALAEKVNAFKYLAEAMKPIAEKKVAEAKAAQEKAAAEQKAKVEAQAKAAAEKLAKEKAEKEEYYAEHPEAKVHEEALAHYAESGNYKKAYLTEAENLLKNAGLDKVLTPVEGASIVAYTGSHYRELNKSIRTDSMTEGQLAFMRSLDAALDKLPDFTEKQVGRKADLPIEVFNHYKNNVGKIVQERAFTSTSKSNDVWSGAYFYQIKSKRGKDVSSISSHKKEKEVLFKSGSRFRVVAVSGNTIQMEEV